ncbi:UNVERIFIED_CONTAM: putative sucrose-phosphate synthase 1 [Sesamum radiatum]|uniref:sucrose-phosphate synthase n=1 Tax=Sesamum radiatum TaxID=300843 RepID=A0AAW2L9N8_SESRA
MAGNDWINSYLEAILDVGPGIDEVKSSLLLRERGRFSPTRYFVEEVITGFDETDLHRSWVRAQATRSPQERNTRLENMCWRIWNLARQKKQILVTTYRTNNCRFCSSLHSSFLGWFLMIRTFANNYHHACPNNIKELLRVTLLDIPGANAIGGERDVVGDLSAHGENNKGRLPRISSVDTMEAWASQQKGKKLYIVLISLHGLIRGENMELGRDSDTGGQVKYVVELARALGSMPGVYRVDLLTRQVSSPEVDWSYGEPTEMLPPRDSEGLTDEMGESSGAYIIRIPFGPKDKYIPKELLWPHIPEFVDGALNHIIQMSKVLGEQIGNGHPVWPVAIHGHYADAGDSAALLSGALNVPMLFTGHSLGRDKLEQLLRQGRLSRDEINSTYKIMRRIEAEELSLDASEIVITSTRQEIEEQWRLYDGFDPILERKLRARIKRNVSCYGRFMPRMVVIPPGMEFHHIIPHDGDMDGETEANEDGKSSDPPIWAEVRQNHGALNLQHGNYKFHYQLFVKYSPAFGFQSSEEAYDSALARPDPKKNLTTLVKAFGECRPLRELANLTLIMGNRDNIDEMSGTNASVLLSILKLIDKYDLYGQVAYPKHHKQSDVPDIYRLAAKTKGVFINPAFIEPFGLTLIEHMVCRLLPQKNGGPVDIHRVLDNGLLVDPHDQQSIADALLKLVADKHLWAKCRANGLKNIHLFSWTEHCKTYLSKIASCKPRQPRWLRNDDDDENSESDSPSDSLRDIQDISLNLKFSFDGDKNESRENAYGSLDSEDRKSKLENAVMTWSKGVAKSAQKSGSTTDKGDHNSSAGKFPALRRRKHIFVIAVDCDASAGLSETVKKIFEAFGNERTEGSVGFILATSFNITEIRSFLISEGLSATDFDAFICNSGGLRKTLVRWAASTTDKKGEKEEHIVVEDEETSADYCYSFKVQKPGVIPPVKEVRKLMRIQALRCHVVYCQNGSKINVIPVLASRSQALRYLYLRWGMDLSKVVVFVGESGDTDYEGLLGGVHKSVVLTGVCSSASSQLHANRSYPLSDVIYSDGPNIARASEECSSDLRVLLEEQGLLKS